jgi:hypothetical protein
VEGGSVTRWRERETVDVDRADLEEALGEARAELAWIEHNGHGTARLEARRKVLLWLREALKTELDGHERD